MDEKLKKLQKNINKKEDELTWAILNHETATVICMKSIELDFAVALYLNTLKDDISENNTVLEEYKDITEREYNVEIINMIKKDVKEQFKNMDEDELEHLCKNVYILCVLKVHKISEYEITKQLMCRNNLFLEEMKKKGKNINSNLDDTNIKFYTKLKDKYLKIIKKEDK